MIRRTAIAVLLLLVAGAASPGTAFAIPAGATMMPMSGMPVGHGSGQASSGCNCNMPVQPAAAPATTARSAGEGRAVPCSGSAVPLTNGIPAYGGRVGGIRRIYPKNVLNHPDRAVVYNAIAARPGIDTATIAETTGMNRETLRYHLDKLEAATRVVVMRDRGIVRYFENHGRYTPLERTVLQHLWNPTGRQMLALIAMQPGITQAELSHAIAVAPPTARWYLHRFRDDGIVMEQRDGKHMRYAVVPEAAGILSLYAPEAVLVPAAITV